MAGKLLVLARYTFIFTNTVLTQAKKLKDFTNTTNNIYSTFPTHKVLFAADTRIEADIYLSEINYPGRTSKHILYGLKSHSTYKNYPDFSNDINRQSAALLRTLPENKLHFNKIGIFIDSESW